MGRFAWFVTTAGSGKGDLTQALKDKIAASVQEELGGKVTPHATIGIPGPMGGHQKMYLQEDGGWNEYRTRAKPFQSKGDAEAAAFNIASRQPEFLGKVGVEKLWTETPEIKFREDGGVDSYYVPPIQSPIGISEYLTERDLSDMGRPMPPGRALNPNDLFEETEDNERP